MRRGLLPLSSALIGALTQAAGSGYIVTSAFAQLVRREDEDVLPPLLVVRSNDAPKIARAGHSSHRSHSSHYSSSGGASSGHSSHASHSSHYSSSGGGGGGGWGGTSADDDTVTAPATVVRPDPPPTPPKPARVVIAAFPGGKIYIDGKAYGADATSTLTLKPGTYIVRVVNRFLGEHTASIQITDGQTGTVAIKW